MMKVQQPVMFGVQWPGGDEVKFTKTELATLTKAVAILKRLRSHWEQDDETGSQTDVALAMYIVEELVEAGGFELDA